MFTKIQKNENCHMKKYLYSNTISPFQNSKRKSPVQQDK